MKILLALLLFAASGLLAVNAQSTTTEFDVDGIKVIFKPTIKNIVNVRFYFRGGVSNYKPEKSGIERLTLASTSQCGTKKYNADAFRDRLDKYGIIMRYGSEFDYGDIEMECIQKYFNEGWDLLSESVLNPAFDADQLTLLKSKIIASIRQGQTSPDDRSEQLLLNNAFEGTSYQADPDGDENVIKNLSADELKAYYASILNKNQVFIVVAGKITKEELVAKVDASFKNLVSRPYTPLEYTEPVWNDNKLISENRELSTNYIYGIMNAPQVNSADFIAYRMGISALGGRLFYVLRTKLNLSYNPGATAVMKQMPYALMYISTTKPKEAVQQMVAILNEFKRNNLSEQWLMNTKNGYVTSFYMRQQSSTAITGSLGLSEIMGNWSWAENLPEMVQRTTTEQIHNVISKYIVGLRWSYLGNQNLGYEAKEAFQTKVN